jgi:sodium/potassium/calcium exchanger 6
LLAGGKSLCIHFITRLKLSIPLSFFLIFMAFRFMSSVVEEYLAPSITYLSEWFKLPEALAAVTLLAFANGAGDVITALVASGTSGGLAYNIGAIYGAGLVYLLGLK